MAQRIFLENPIHQYVYTIDDEDLCLFEFQDFFIEVKKKFSIEIDGY